MERLRCVLNWAMTIVAAMALAGCNPFSDAGTMMDEYVERVGRVMERPPELRAIPSGERLPLRRDRRLPMPELDIGMLDFLSLYGCELQYVIGERNSVMGRVMQPLNRLRYELAFIEAARDCLPDIERQTLRQALERAIESKLESLPIAAWNASWGSEAIESLVALSKGPLPVIADPNQLAVLAADLRLWNETLEEIAAGQLEPSLTFAGGMQQRWQSAPAAGQLMRSAHLLIARLDDASRLLRQRVDGQPLCREGKPNPRASNALGLLTSVYAGKVQPYLAEVRRGRDLLIAPLARMASLQQAVMPAHFQVWYRHNLELENPDGLWARLDVAMQRHTRSWQQLLQQCGLSLSQF